VLLLAVTGLTAIGAASASAFGEQIAMSWEMITDSPTTGDQDSQTREGTATFANGEKAHIVVHTVHPRTNSFTTDGTAVSVGEYKFDDGSGFTLRFVEIWNALEIRTAGLFSEGTGHFAGMAGSATGGGYPPGMGYARILWTGTYELAKK
jgi:hypothetical protein